MEKYIEFFLIILITYFCCFLSSLFILHNYKSFLRLPSLLKYFCSRFSTLYTSFYSIFLVFLLFHTNISVSFCLYFKWLNESLVNNAENSFIEQLKVNGVSEGGGEALCYESNGIKRKGKGFSFTFINSYFVLPSWAAPPHFSPSLLL